MKRRRMPPMTTATGSLLFDEPPIAVNPALARALGLSAAVVVQQLHYWTSRATAHVRTGPDGVERRWVYNTYESWAGTIPVGERTIRRCLETLRAAGVVHGHEFDRHKGDRRLWYSLDTDALARYVEDLNERSDIPDEDGFEAPPHLAKMARPHVDNLATPHLAKMATPSGHFGQTLDLSTETTTETTKGITIPLKEQQQERSTVAGATASDPDTPDASPDATAADLPAEQAPVRAPAAATAPPAVVVSGKGMMETEATTPAPVDGHASAPPSASSLDAAASPLAPPADPDTPSSPTADMPVDSQSQRDHLADELVRRGLNARVARRLVRGTEAPDMRRHIAHFDRLSAEARATGERIENPGAFLRRLIEENWGVPSASAMPATPVRRAPQGPPHPSRTATGTPDAPRIASPESVRAILAANGFGPRDTPAPPSTP